MKINVRQRIISGITALSIFSSALFPAATVFSEEMPSSEPETSVVETTPETAGTDADASETSHETVTEYTDETESDTESSVEDSSSEESSSEESSSEESTSEEESSEQSESETTAQNTGASPQAGGVPVTTAASDEAAVIITDNNFSCSDTDTDISLTVNNGMYILDDGTDIAKQDVSFVADAISVDDYIYQLDVDRRVKCVRAYNMKFEYDYHRVVAISNDVTVKYTFTEDVPEEEASSVAVYTVQSGVWTQISTDAPVIEYGYVKSVSFRATLPELDMFCVVWTDPESVKPDESILSSDRNYYYSDLGIEATATAFTGAMCTGEPDEGSEGAEYGALPENANNIELTLDVLDEYDERRSLFDIKDGETVSIYSTRFFSEKYHNVTVSDYETEITYTLSEPVPEDKAYSVMAFVPGTEHMTLLPSEKIIDNGYITAIRFTVKDGIFAVFENISLNILTVSAENEYTITVKYDKGAGIPDGAELSVSEENAEYYLDDTADALGWSDDDYICYTRFFDIAIMKDGIEYEPQTPVIVTADLHDATEAPEALQVVHIDDEGASEVEIGSAADAQITFAAESFSVYGFGSALHTVLSENNGTTELSVFSALSDSGISAAPMEINALTEGLETENAFGFTVTDSASVGKLWIMANVAEGAELDGRESFSVYSVYNNEASIVLIPDITENEGLCPVGLGVNAIALIRDTGFRRTSLDIKVDGEESGKSVTMDGLMPKTSEGRAVDVTGAFAGEYAEYIEDKSLLAAYDLSIFEKTEAQQETPAAESAATDGTVPAESITVETSEGTAEAAYPGESFTGEAPEGYAEGTYEQQTMNTAADRKYQPGEERPVHVEITDPRITADGEIFLYHIKDDMTKEEITDFTVEDGKIGFEAVGFSVYQIVAAKPPLDLPTDAVSSPDDIIEGRGYYLSIYRSSTYYMSEKETAVSQTTGSGTGEFLGYTNKDNAATWFFEKSNDGQFYIYTYVEGEQKYIYVYNTKLIKLSETDKTAFKIEQTKGNIGKSLYIYITDSNKNFAFSVRGVGNFFLENRTNGNNTNERVILTPSVTLPYDYYELDGKTYCFAYYRDGVEGAGLIAEEFINNNKSRLKATQALLRPDVLYGAGDFLITKGIDLPRFTFTCRERNIYNISTKIGGETKYITLNGDNLVLGTDPDASGALIAVTSGTGENKNKYQFSANGRSIALVGGKAANGFASSTNGNDKSWLNLVEPSSVLTNDDFIIYSAEKTDISKVSDQEEIVIYCREWNDEDKKYEFYIINHDGSLIRGYESGDMIQWVGTAVSTAEWLFTEYLDNGNSNAYYELQNTYSGKYLAPEGQKNAEDPTQDDVRILSDETIGLNLPGREYGYYYSKILAWCEEHYRYAGLTTDENKELSVTSKENAEDYYFAKIRKINETGDKTTVTTLDNAQYGITMKMVDFNGLTTQYPGATSTIEQNDVMGHTAYDSKNPIGKKDLLKDTLGDDGYPVAKLTGRSLKDLFGNAEKVNHLFIDNTYKTSGYFEFDSTQNYATLVDKNGNFTTSTDSAGDQAKDFTVFAELGTTNDDRHSMKHGQFFPYNYLSDNYSTNYNMYPAKVKNNDSDAELPDSDPRKEEKMFVAKGTIDYYFGVELEASFTQTEDGKDNWDHDIIYEFTGDDDFWLYVDGILVIDLGGVHSAMSGKVNYCTGKVEVEGYDEYSDKTLKTSLYEIYKANYKNNHPGATESEVNNYLNDIFKLKDGNYVFKDYTSHTMRIFYMERGAGASNLKMKFNLSSVKPGTVLLSKELDGIEDKESFAAEYSYRILYKKKGSTEELMLYPGNGDGIEVKYKDTERNVTYNTVPPNDPENPFSATHKPEDCVYILKPGETAEFTMPNEITEYKIIECNVDSNLYDHVYINTVEVTGIGSERLKNYETDYKTIVDRPTVDYKNHVNPEKLKTLTITKLLFDETGNNPIHDDKTEFKYRLWLGTENNELKLANMYNYQVKDPNGYYCTWDKETQCFKSTTVNNFSDFSTNEKAEATFSTSIYGTIARIPADYTVEIRELLSGTKFKVEERPSEIPKGYSLQKYYVTGPVTGPASYSSATTLKIDDRDYQVDVRNMKGWGLSMKKVWSDVDFMESRDDVYFAVYLADAENENTIIRGPLDNTVRRLKKDDTSLYWYFSHLEDNMVFDNYVVYEVKLEGPFTVDEETNEVSGYTLITPVKSNETIEVAGRQIGYTPDPDDPDPVEPTNTYTVTYDQDKIENTENRENNIREVTVTNSRPGIKLYKRDMYEKPLPGGVFTLKDEGGNDVAASTYTSDENGLITTAYLGDGWYTLTEIIAPTGYQAAVGKADYNAFHATVKPLQIKIASDETEWRTWWRTVPEKDKGIYKGKTEDVVFSDIYPLEFQGGDNSSYFSIAGTSEERILNIYNKKYTLRAVKIDGNTDVPIEGVHFALYREVKNFTSNQNKKYMRDYLHIEGFDDLVSNAEGELVSSDGTKILTNAFSNGTLKPGTYYLSEKAPADGYKPLPKDVLFTVTPAGHVYKGSPNQISYYGDDDNEVDIESIDGEEIEYKEMSYDIIIKNFTEEFRTITVKKKVEEPSKADSDGISEFFFTAELRMPDKLPLMDYTSPDGDLSGFENGEATFKLTNGQEKSLIVPEGAVLTVKETADTRYDTKNQWLPANDTARDEEQSLTCSVTVPDKDGTILFTNTRKWVNVTVTKELNDDLKKEGTFNLTGIVIDNGIDISSSIIYPDDNNTDRKDFDMNVTDKKISKVFKVPVGASFSVTENLSEEQQKQYTVTYTNNPQNNIVQNKTITVKNTRKKNTVTVTKKLIDPTVTGSKPFPFTVTLYNTDGVTPVENYELYKNGDTLIKTSSNDGEKGIAKFTLSAENSKDPVAQTLNIPYGAVLKVSEDHNDYHTTIVQTTGEDSSAPITNTVKTITVTENTTLAYTNSKDTQDVDLTITKQVDGALGEKNKHFDINVRITDTTDTEYTEPLDWKIYDSETDSYADQTEKLAYNSNAGGYVVSLTHKEKIMICSIPSGYKVTLTENGAAEYETEYSGDITAVGKSAEITMNESKNVTITNTLNGVIPTGAHLPEVSIVFAGLLALGVLYFAKRQRLRVTADDTGEDDSDGE